MKKYLLITLTLFMFFFKNQLYANYEKVFYDFTIKSLSGEMINLADYKNKAVLIVNTASFCGFTKQYEDLQILWEKYRSDGLVVLGVPSNSFNQESSDNDEVKDFCETNFNISFPMTEITSVKGENKHEIFKWAKENYGNAAVPKWNFHKILINKDGKIQNTFNSFTKPVSKKITTEIEKILEING